MKTAARACVQPRKTPWQPVHAELAAPEIFKVYVGDLQFTPGARLQPLGDADHLVVVEVQAGHRVAAPGLLGFLLDGDRPACRIKFDHAIALWIVHMVSKDYRPAVESVEGLLDHLGAGENIVPQNQGHRIPSNERFGDKKGHGDAVGLFLFTEVDPESKPAAVPEQLAEPWQILGRGDQAKLPDSAFDQGRERIVNHRLVVNRLELLA